MLCIVLITGRPGVNYTQLSIWILS